MFFHPDLAHTAARSISAGQNTTFFLAKPNQKLSDLPRHPEDLTGVPETCVACGEDRGDDDSPLECDKVLPRVWFSSMISDTHLLNSV